jgi:hypothetical protein
MGETYILCVCMLDHIELAATFKYHGQVVLVMWTTHLDLSFDLSTVY